MTKKIRTMAVCAMVAGLCGWFQLTAAAFTNVNNAFASDTNNPNAGLTSISASATVISGGTQTATIGPGFLTTVSVGGGIVYTESVEINNLAVNPGSMTISGSGVAGVGATFSATKLFTGNTLSDNTTYQFTLSKAAGSSVNLLTGLQFTIAIGAQQQINVNTVTTDLLAANSAVYTFTTGNVDNVTAFSLTISGNTAVGLLNNSFTFTGASLIAVPESSPTWLGLMGGMGIWVLRRSRLTRG